MSSVPDPFARIPFAAEGPPLEHRVEVADQEDPLADRPRMLRDQVPGPVHLRGHLGPARREPDPLELGPEDLADLADPGRGSGWHSRCSRPVRAARSPARPGDRRRPGCAAPRATILARSPRPAPPSRPAGRKTGVRRKREAWTVLDTSEIGASRVRTYRLADSTAKARGPGRSDFLPMPSRRSPGEGGVKLNVFFANSLFIVNHPNLRCPDCRERYNGATPSRTPVGGAGSWNGPR